MPRRRRGQAFATSRLPISESKFSLQLHDRSENFTDHLLVSLPELYASNFPVRIEPHFRFLAIDDHSDEIVASRRSFSDRFRNRQFKFLRGNGESWVLAPPLLLERSNRSPFYRGRLAILRPTRGGNRSRLFPDQFFPPIVFRGAGAGCWPLISTA